MNKKNTRPLRVALCADIHIRPHTFHDEMEYTFDRFFESIVDKKVDLVCCAGDVYHNKLTVSNEYFQVAYNFFKKLSDICPVIVILGNHDVAISNQSRLDAVTPVIEALRGSKHTIKLSKYSESFDLKEVIPNWEGDVKFHHLSILDDKDKWVKKEDLDPSFINVSLYHGAINNCIVDSGWVSRGNRDDLDIFSGMDFGFLGDIHKCQFLDQEKRIAYPGSIRQNNFGEDIDKGYLFWEITSKDDFKVERVVLPQKRYFFTLHLTGIKDLANVGDLPPDCRIRVKSLKPFDLAEEIKIKEDIIEKYKPQGDVLIQPPEEDISGLSSVTKISNLDVIHDNIRDIEVQKQLLKEYLKKKGVPQEKIDQVVVLDKVYHSSVDTDVLRNVIYHIKKLKMDNFLSYGKDNEINFDKLNGLIGIFGANGCGKSSIIDSVFFLLQNGVYREGATKNGEYINRRCKRADLRLEVSMNNETYIIDRSIKKVFTKDKEEPKIENELDFYKLPKLSLNGETIPETNKNIKDIFGTKEDLELTSLASQFGLMTLIEARGTKRKESFAKFFDLGVFETKFDLALKDHKEIKTKLKDCNKDVLLKSVNELQENIIKAEELKSSCEEQISTHQDIINDLDEELLKYTSEIRPTETFKASTDQYREWIEHRQKLIENIENHQNMTLEFLALAERKLSDLKPKLTQLQTKSSRLAVLDKQAGLIKTIPNEEVCRKCHLAASAYEAANQASDLRVEIGNLEVRKGSLASEFAETEEFIKSAKEVQQYKKDIETYQGKLSLLLEAEEIIKRNDELKVRIGEISKLKKSCQQVLLDYNKKLMECVSDISANKTRLSDIQSKIKLEIELAQKDEIYSLYLDAMGKNGISYWIVSKKLVLINKLVNQILSFAVPFRFSIEDNEEEKSIKIFVIDEKGKRPVELCSGGEKTLIAIALRAALWKICLLPKTPILILDESLSFLDGERYDSVVKLLKHLRNDYFEKIFVITHNEELKRVVDTSVVVDKRRGFSFVEVK